MKIFTYFIPPSDATIATQLKLVLGWQTSWQAQGFETHVLNEWDGRDWLMAMIDRGGLYSDYRVRNLGWQLTKGDMGRAGAEKVLALIPGTEHLLFGKPEGYAQLLTTRTTIVEKGADALLRYEEKPR